MIRSPEFWQWPRLAEGTGVFKTLALAVGLWPMLNRNTAPEKVARPEFFQLRNRSLAVHFDLSTGLFQVWRDDSTPLQLDLTGGIGLPEGTRCAADDEFAREIKVTENQLQVTFFDARRQLAIRFLFLLGEENEGSTVQMTVRNVSRKTMRLNGLDLRAEGKILTEQTGASLKPGAETSIDWNWPAENHFVPK